MKGTEEKKHGEVTQGDAAGRRLPLRALVTPTPRFHCSLHLGAGLCVWKKQWEGGRNLGSNESKHRGCGSRADLWIQRQLLSLNSVSGADHVGNSTPNVAHMGVASCVTGCTHCMATNRSVTFSVSLRTWIITQRYACTVTHIRTAAICYTGEASRELPRPTGNSTHSFGPTLTASSNAIPVTLPSS